MKVRESVTILFYFWDFGEYLVVVNLVSNIPILSKVSHRFHTLMVHLPSLRPAVTGILIIDTHQEMVIVDYLPKRSGQVYDNWTMM